MDIKYWYIMAAVVMVLAALAVWRLWRRLPEEKKKEFFLTLRRKVFPTLNAWLLLATEKAEDFIGSGNGQKKLAMVYGWFCQWFPWLSKIMPFALFERLVDDALDLLRQKLESGNALSV